MFSATLRRESRADSECSLLHRDLYGVGSFQSPIPHPHQVRKWPAQGHTTRERQNQGLGAKDRCSFYSVWMSASFLSRKTLKIQLENALAWSLIGRGDKLSDVEHMEPGRARVWLDLPAGIRLPWHTVGWCSDRNSSLSTGNHTDKSKDAEWNAHCLGWS